MRLHSIFATKLVVGESLKTWKVSMSLVSVRSLVVLVAVFACALVAMPRSEAEGYPSRPIKLLVGAPPGGTTDTVARALEIGRAHV